MYDRNKGSGDRSDVYSPLIAQANKVCDMQIKLILMQMTFAGGFYSCGVGGHVVAFDFLGMAFYM